MAGRKRARRRAKKKTVSRAARTLARARHSRCPTCGKAHKYHSRCKSKKRRRR